MHPVVYSSTSGSDSTSKIDAAPDRLLESLGGSLYFDLEATTVNHSASYLDLRVNSDISSKTTVFSTKPTRDMVSGHEMSSFPREANIGTVRRSQSPLPPPPPRRQSAGLHLVAETTNARPGPESSLLFELDVRIHVDSGRCVLHSQLASRTQPLSKIPSRPSRVDLQNSTPAMAPDLLISGYLLRYKHHLEQDPSQKPTDISLFYLPAVDIGLHYASHTMLGLSQAPVFTTISPHVINHTDSRDAVNGGLGPSEVHFSQVKSGLGLSSQPPMASNNLRRSADLYVTCILQKLPKELVLHPGLLDFLEQALDNLPFLPESEVESHANIKESEEEESRPLDTLLSTSKVFPVDVVVHLQVQSSILRCLCLPTSNMQCLMTLPSLDVVFSTERQLQEDVGAVPRPLLNTTELHHDEQSHLCGGVKPVKSVGNGDIVSAGGLRITAIITEFCLSVFHPYGDVSSLRVDGNWLPGSSGDSLTLKVRGIRLNISRTVQTVLSQSAKVHSSGDSATQDLAATFCTTSTLPPPRAVASASSGDSHSLHNILRFSGVFDIDSAEFNCDTRRTVEILEISNAWYRSSLARRFFIGEEALVSGETAAAACIPRSESTIVPETADGGIGYSEAPLPQPTGIHQSQLSSWLQSNPKIECPVSSNTAPSPILSTPGTRSELQTGRCATVPQSVARRYQTPSSRTLPRNQTMTSMQASASRAGSLGVTSWEALPIFYVNVNRLDVEMYIGSAMGRTRLNVRNLFCNGRLFRDSSKCVNTSLGMGLSSCQLVSEKGIVGGEITVLDLETRVHVKEDAKSDPQHSSELVIGGVQARIEYMNTNIVFLRLSQAEMYLHDEWRIREARQLVGDCLQQPSMPYSDTSTASPPSGRLIASESPLSTPKESFCDAVEYLQTTIGAPPVYIMVIGEANWDQLQMAISRTTTVDLIHAALKVSDYFEEQFREGRMSLLYQEHLFRSDSTGVQVDTVSGGGEAALNTALPLSTAPTVPSLDDRFIDRVLQRHWQRSMLEAIQTCLCHVSGLGHREEQMFREILVTGGVPDSTLFDANSLPPVLGGSLQLSGRSLALACFAGTFRSAPDWAVFNLQHPTICFETESQREPPPAPLTTKPVDASGASPALLATPTSPQEVGGWLNIRQVLSLDLGQQPLYRARMAYVLRVRRGRSQNLMKLAVLPTIAEWMEFMFRAADNTVMNHVRNYSAGESEEIVKLTDFQVDFVQDSYSAPSLIHINGPHSVSRSDFGSGVSDSMPRRDDSSNGGPRANPLNPHLEAEILFVLPSISLRLTSDQRQSMTRPTIQEMSAFAASSQNSKTSETDENKPKAARPREGVSEVVDKPEREAEEEASTLPVEQLSSDPTRPAPEVPIVRLSFQTDFHGVIQLGLIDVPWLPSLIHSYLSEQLHERDLFPTGDVMKLASQRAAVLTHLHQWTAAGIRTSSPMIQDVREYDVVHWSLSPECRWLLATNIAVPAFDMLLENIGFRRARSTIPKWLQRGLMDHLDAIMSGLILASLRFVSTEDRHQMRHSSNQRPVSKVTSPLEEVTNAEDSPTQAPEPRESTARPKFLSL